MKAIEIKIEVFETNLSTVKKSLVEKDTFISTLESRIQEFEELNKEQNAKIEDIECLKDKFSNPANLIPVKSVNSLKCTKYEFEMQSEQGLKTHITRIHTLITNGCYPKSCDLCEKQFGNAGDMKIHMRNHSFKEAKFKCEDCDFVGQSRETMEVHIGKSHTDKFEC